MPRTKAEPTASPARHQPETLAERIEFLCKHSGGTMPVGMIVHNQDDFNEATRLLKASRNKAAKLILVRLEDK